MEEKNCEIFINTIKDIDENLYTSEYSIMCLGDTKLESKYTLPIFYDNTGDNISYLNKGICEYTGMYFLWKNYEFKKPYVGFAQYRVKLNLEKYDINKILTDYKIILPNKMNLSKNLWGQYNSCHNIQDLIDIQNIFGNIYPQFLNIFKDVMNGNYLYTNNLFVMKVNDFKEYCEFIWSIISVYLKEKNITSYEDCIKQIEDNENLYLKTLKRNPQNSTVEYQSRFLAYLIERLTNVFIHIKYHEKDIFTIEKIRTMKKYESD